MGYSLGGGSLPIHQCRGFETLDINYKVTLIEGSINSVIQALQATRQLINLQQDVYGLQVQLATGGFIICQLVGHPWTVLIDLPGFPAIDTYTSNVLDIENPLIISLKDKRAIYAVNSDTSVSIGYKFYINGSLTERFFYCLNDSEDDELDDLDDSEDERPEGVYEFWSERRLIMPEEILNPYDFADSFLQEQEAFVPCLFPRSFVREGDLFLLSRNGLDRSDFIRMDYLIFHSFS
ncbi:hypothetical protein [Leptolyngbya sp. GGD]|uniref:hypothetical protein n=1 Tax=Leptolyngbya sp. GGD TaxID=2997907 RepID=UPI00227A75B0|nr:hypothetical protein [Leptolyngbya sp. GGD]MCY6494608.1 hypothetical protein [Leptolyngbya sp. GGD]